MYTLLLNFVYKFLFLAADCPFAKDIPAIKEILFEPIFLLTQFYQRQFQIHNKHL